LKNDAENEAGLEQLTQLLLDQGKSSEAITLLEGVTAKSSSPTLLDLLGDAYTQTKDLAKAEDAYRRAADLSRASRVTNADWARPCLPKKNTRKLSRSISGCRT
jgi:predicted negative regulator of RcsB-dependent stress response